MLAPDDREQRHPGVVTSSSSAHWVTSSTELEGRDGGFLISRNQGSSQPSRGGGSPQDEGGAVVTSHGQGEGGAEAGAHHGQQHEGPAAQQAPAGRRGGNTRTRTLPSSANKAQAVWRLSQRTPAPPLQGAAAARPVSGSAPPPPRLGALSAERWPCSLLHCPPADTPLVGIRKHRNVRLQAREQRQLGHKHPACRQEPPYPGGEHSLLQLEPQEPPEL